MKNKPWESIILPLTLVLNLLSTEYWVLNLLRVLSKSSQPTDVVWFWIRPYFDFNPKRSGQLTIAIIWECMLVFNTIKHIFELYKHIIMYKTEVFSWNDPARKENLLTFSLSVFQLSGAERCLCVLFLLRWWRSMAFSHWECPCGINWSSQSFLWFSGSSYLRFRSTPISVPATSLRHGSGFSSFFWLGNEEPVVLYVNLWKLCSSDSQVCRLHSSVVLYSFVINEDRIFLWWLPLVAVWEWESADKQGCFSLWQHWEPECTRSPTERHTVGC